MDRSDEDENLEIARRWCAAKGDDWLVLDEAGRGGTAPVFTVSTPNGPLALKLYDRLFSQGERGEESERRLGPQVALGLHDCPYIVRVHEGGRFEDRLFLLMDKAPGQELEKRLKNIPRSAIRTLVDQLARACLYLRERNLSHRDIKSANIFVTDDFKKLTLLDLSVVRDIEDPIGLGTDDGKTLPVVATSRYSPPEYLFRLHPPSPELWHALDVYQIGGVLHDLIMREPMFEEEYRVSKDTNRYRFAWIVATQEPLVQAVDVDASLIMLAKRALDKDWMRRGSLRLEDFLDDSEVRSSQGLQALGANFRGAPSNRSAATRWMAGLSEEVEQSVSASLRSIGITARHTSKVGGSDQERLVEFFWDVSEEAAGGGMSSPHLSARLAKLEEAGRALVGGEITLASDVMNQRRTASMSIPPAKADEDAASYVSAFINAALGQLAAEILGQ